MQHEPIIEIESLKKIYNIPKGIFKKDEEIVAVNDISFSIEKGKAFALVGESGCGKSTVARTILRLTKETSGKVKFKGKDILKLNYKEMLTMRKKMQIVFQDPYASLNPKKSIEQILIEPLNIHNIHENYQRKLEVKKILGKVGLSNTYLSRFPHELSGGQRQRIGIARAVIMKPEFIIADEPVSALDISIQSQIINLFLELQKEMGLTYLFISHDLSVVEHIADKVAVMYLGRIVEVGKIEDLFQNSKHPYTKALISAIPKNHPNEQKERIELYGELPSPSNPPLGCLFNTRCPYVMDICTREVPKEIKLHGNHSVYCHLYSK